MLMNDYWTSNEPGLAEHGEWSFADMVWLYAETVDKDEYPSLDGWFWDMQRSGVFFRHKTSATGR